MVEGRGRAAVRNVIRYSRTKSEEDLGEDSEAWTLKYGSDSVKEQVIPMTEIDAEDSQMGRSNGVAGRIALPAPTPSDFAKATAGQA